MNTDDRMILTIERDVLFADRYFTEFLPAREGRFEEVIRSRAAFRRRGPAENDPSFKQPIGYAVVVNPGRRCVFAYQRAAEGARYDEDRLRGKWSWGVGGHIERSDSGGADPLRESLLRELAEEVSWDGPLDISVLGYLNDDATDVGRVHFGVLYVAETQSPEIRPRSPEIARGRLYTLDELRAILRDPGSQVEEWSRIAFPPLVRHLAG